MEISSYFTYQDVIIRSTEREKKIKGGGREMKKKINKIHNWKKLYYCVHMISEWLCQKVCTETMYIFLIQFYHIHYLFVFMHCPINVSEAIV